LGVVAVAVAVEVLKWDSLSSPIFESHDTHAGKYLTRYRWFVVGGEGLETVVPGRAGREADCPLETWQWIINGDPMAQRMGRGKRVIGIRWCGEVGAFCLRWNCVACTPPFRGYKESYTISQES
jgi:hypothetical protein